jgi:hypothetical protein
MSSSSATMSREELRESAMRVDSLSAQLAGLQKEVGGACVLHFNRYVTVKNPVESIRSYAQGSLVTFISLPKHGASRS